MEIKNIFAISALILQLFVIVNVEASTFDITKFGARANDNSHDSTQALLKAWKEACAVPKSQVVIPKGAFTMNQVRLEGPCKGPIELVVQGTVKAPADSNQIKLPAGQAWFTIFRLDDLTVRGGGTFDGQGAHSWHKNDCTKNYNCKILPYNLAFIALKRATVHDITSLDSKSFHVNVIGCEGITFTNFKIIAPEDSPNTDGIHIGRVNGVTIKDSVIRTGDDCISIGDGSKQVHIEKVTCGPGHGISVGSLGRYANEEDVDGIYVRNCTFIKTMNGVRVKTWPDSKPGVANDIQFENIIMQDVGTPILVDQEYCPWNQCKNKNPSRVKLSKIGFKNIKGTSTTKCAVKLVCSRNLPCQGVEIGNIDLRYSGPEGPAVSECANVKPAFVGKQFPAICAK